MIVVDSSVWISFFNGVATDPVGRLRSYLGTEEILVGDLILCEVLQGFCAERDVAMARDAFAAFGLVAIVGPAIAMEAAAHYRGLRRRGITVRKTIDLLIGTFCIHERHALLHDDRDYEPMVEHLGLRIA